MAYNAPRYFSRFLILVSWLESNSDVDEEKKLKFIAFFDLNRFTNDQVTETLRQSNLFSDSLILDVVTQMTKMMQARTESLEKLVEKSSAKRENHWHKIV